MGFISRRGVRVGGAKTACRMLLTNSERIWREGQQRRTASPLPTPARTKKADKANGKLSTPTLAFFQRSEQMNTKKDLGKNRGHTKRPSQILWTLMDTREEISAKIMGTYAQIALRIKRSGAHTQTKRPSQQAWTHTNTNKPSQKSWKHTHKNKPSQTPWTHTHTD